MTPKRLAFDLETKSEGESDDSISSVGKKSSSIPDLKRSTLATETPGTKRKPKKSRKPKDEEDSFKETNLSPRK